MAELSSEDRARVHRGLMRFMSPRVAEFPCSGFTEAELRDAIDDADVWIDANQASFVAALPEPFKTSSGATVKTLLFCAVAAMRVSADFARRTFGEVD